MKAVGLTEFGGPEVLHLLDLPEPKPGPDEVLIVSWGLAPPLPSPAPMGQSEGTPSRWPRPTGSR